MSIARNLSKLAKDAQLEAALDIGYDTDKSIPQKEDVEARLTDVTTAQAVKDANQDNEIVTAQVAAADAQTSADQANASNVNQDALISQNQTDIGNLQTADADNAKKSGSVTQFSDVDTATVAPTDDQVLQWDAATGLWKAETLPTTDLSAYQTAADATNQFVDVAGDSMTGTLQVSQINTAAGDLTLDSATNKVIVDGDLVVTGTRLENAQETSTYQNAFLNLNTNATGVPLDTQDAGLLVSRGDSPEAQLIWDESNDRWSASTDGGVTYQPLSYLSETQAVQTSADAAQADATQALTNAATAQSTADGAVTANGTQDTAISQNATDIANLQTSDANSVKNTDSIDALADVDTTTAAPTSNQVLGWSGTQWVPQTVAAVDTVTTINHTDLIATANQSAFSVPHDAGTVPWVTLNGIRLKPTTDYANDATAGTVTLTEAAAAGDEFGAISWSTAAV